MIFTISGKKYHLFSVILKELAFRDSSANVLAALAFNCRNVASCFLIKYVPPPSMFELNWLWPSIFFCQICWLYNLVTEYACKHWWTSWGINQSNLSKLFLLQNFRNIVGFTLFFSILEIKPCVLGSRMEAESHNWSLISFLGESLVSRTGAAGWTECWVKVPKCASRYDNSLCNLRGQKWTCPCYHARHLQQIHWQK